MVSAGGALRSAAHTAMNLCVVIPHPAGRPRSEGETIRFNRIGLTIEKKFNDMDNRQRRLLVGAYRELAGRQGNRRVCHFSGPPSAASSVIARAGRSQR